MTLKEIVEAEKPWFDYARYLLGIAAWFVAIGYVAADNLRPQPPGSWAMVGITWASVALATIFGIFLIFRVARMQIALTSEIVSIFGEKGLTHALIRMCVGFWFFIGLPTFLFALCGALVFQLARGFKP